MGICTLLVHNTLLLFIRSAFENRKFEFILNLYVYHQPVSESHPVPKKICLLCHHNHDIFRYCQI